MIIALAVLTGLVLILASTASTQRVALKAEVNRLQARRARLAALSGVQRAMAEFATEQTATTNSSGAKTLSDDWATLGNKGDENFVLSSESFRMEIVDQSSFVNVNTAAQAQLERLPLTGEQVDCLLDWRETARQPRSDGAKDEFYNQLQNPYNAKLGRLNSVDELLLVKSFTPATLFQPQQSESGATLVQGNDQDQPLLVDLVTTDSACRPLSPTGQAKFNVNAPGLSPVQLTQQLLQRGIPTAIANQIVARRGTFTGIGQILAVPGVGANVQAVRAILDNLTTSAQPRLEGKINLNTATEPVLNTIPAITPDVAAAIVARQNTGFVGLSDLLDIPGLNNTQMLRQIVDLVDVTSSTFVIRVLGKAGETTVPIEATVEIQNGAAKILKIEEPSYTDVVTRWHWQQDTTSDTTLKEAS